MGGELGDSLYYAVECFNFLFELFQESLGVVEVFEGDFGEVCSVWIFCEV